MNESARDNFRAPINAAQYKHIGRADVPMSPSVTLVFAKALLPLSKSVRKTHRLRTDCPLESQ
jgi:hypothetical protein